MLCYFLFIWKSGKLNQQIKTRCDLPLPSFCSVSLAQFLEMFPCWTGNENVWTQSSILSLISCVALRSLCLWTSAAQSARWDCLWFYPKPLLGWLLGSAQKERWNLGRGGRYSEFLLNLSLLSWRTFNFLCPQAPGKDTQIPALAPDLAGTAGLPPCFIEQREPLGNPVKPP